MQRRPAGVPHPLSRVRRLEAEPWHGGDPPTWGLDDPRSLDERELAFELAHCAVELDVSLADAAKEVGVGQQRARRALDRLRQEAAPRRGKGAGPLSDSAIFKRLARRRLRSGRVCLAPNCGRQIPAAKRAGTFACSARCRKRIFDAGGRAAILDYQKQELVEQAREARLAKLPPASPLVVRCERCGACFSDPSAIADFRSHRCTGPAELAQPS